VHLSIYRINANVNVNGSKEKKENLKEICIIKYIMEPTPHM